MVFNLTHSQLILRYKENGGRIEPYTIVIMGGIKNLQVYSVLRLRYDFLKKGVRNSKKNLVAKWV
jgi:hypothetical protein